MILNWRNNRQGYWMNGTLLAFADIPFILFALVPASFLGAAIGRAATLAITDRCDTGHGAAAPAGTTTLIPFGF